MATNETKTIDVEEKEVKTTAKTSSTKSSAKEIELEKQLASMAEIIKNLQEQINSVNKNNTTIQPNIVVTAPTNDVTLVYMSDSLGFISAKNVELNCTRFGEEFSLSRSDFDAIVGKYRSWFDAGILAVSSKNVDVAAAKGLKTDKEYAITADQLSKLGKMSLAELENFWSNVTAEAQKVSIVTYFKRKFIENKEAGYRDRAKIDLLNRLTDGGFNREALELSSSDTTYRPVEIDWNR